MPSHIPGSLIKSGLNNIRSANQKFSLLTQLFADKKLDLLILTETWQIPSIDGKVNTFAASLKDYAAAEELDVNVLSKPRTDGRRGGGVALIIRSHFVVSSQKLVFPFPVSFEYLSSKIKLVHPLILISIYRLNSTNSPPFQTFIMDFRNLLISLSDFNNCIIAGDFNIKVNLVSDSETTAFLTLLSEFNFKIIAPSSPTHRLGNTLDFLVVPSDFMFDLTPLIVDHSVLISDHYPVLFYINNAGIQANCNRREPYSFRDYKSIDPDDLDLSLSDALSHLLNNDSLSFSDYLSSYRNSVNSVLDQLAPLQFREGRLGKKKPPWMDAEYVRERSLRKRLERSGDSAAYNAQKRHCAYLAKTKRKSYCNTAIANAAGSNQTQLFKLLNKLIDNVKKISNLPEHSDPTVLANQFNSYFSNKVQTIHDSIPPSSSIVREQVTPLPALSSQSEGHLNCFQETNIDELRRIIVKHGVMVGPEDLLTPYLIKNHLDVLLPHFVNLVNLSLSTSSCDGIKEAHIVPILKSINLDKEMFNNFRPVSLLSFISKLTERVVHMRINSHLDSNSLNNNSQYGYKKHHGCDTMILKLIDDIFVAVDKKFGVVMLIIDLSAAFDTVDHRLLLNMLQFKYRITGSALAWLKSFLTGRLQRVKIGNSLSDPLLVLFGVAQGSILGPLLFNLYCSSINEVFKSCGFDCMGYADDNLGFRLFSARSSLSACLFSVPNCIRAVKEWTDNHFLKINTSKTQLMVFGSRHFLSSFNLMSVRSHNGDIIPISKSIKFLGVELDRMLNFNLQITSMCSLANLTLKNVRSIRKLMDEASAEKLIHAIVTNRIDFCNALFVGLSCSNLAKLQLLQNNAIRTVLKLHPHASVSQHLKDKHWLPAKARIYFRFLTVIFKCLNNMAPVELANKLHIACPINMTLKTNLFYPSTEFGKRAFSYLAPRYWNGLPRELRTIVTIDVFKASLKTFLFENLADYENNCFPYTTERISSSQPIENIDLITVNMDVEDDTEYV